MDTAFCEYLVTNADAVEAAIIVTDDGHPHAWYAQQDCPLDGILTIGLNLLGSARELLAIDTTSEASMVFETTFGALTIHTIASGMQLLLYLSGDYSLLAIEQLLHQQLDAVTEG